MDDGRAEEEYFRGLEDKKLSAKIYELSRGDLERGHIEADEILCSLLESKYPLTVAAFRESDKWYA